MQELPTIGMLRQTFETEAWHAYCVGVLLLLNNCVSYKPGISSLLWVQLMVLACHWAQIKIIAP